MKLFNIPLPSSKIPLVNPDAFSDQKYTWKAVGWFISKFQSHAVYH